MIIPIKPIFLQKKISLKPLKNFFSFIFPSNAIEWFLWILFLSVYGALGSYLAINYRIVYDDRVPWDAYFSFDNYSILNTGGGFERHPLANYFFEGIRKLALWISGNRKDEVFRLVLVWVSNFAVSLTLIQIFKYLKNIIGLPSKINCLIVICFAFFTTPILLSFTPETYTFTFLFLTLYQVYVAQRLQEEKKIQWVPLTLGSVMIGGLTITNIVKVYLPLLFEKKVFSKIKNLGHLILRGAVSLSVFLLLYLYRLDFDYMRIFNKAGEQYERFSKPKVTPLWDMMYSWFLGGNILFSNFLIRDYHNKKGFQYKALFMEVYSSVVPYVMVALVFVLVFWSYGKNFKNKLVQILMLSFLVDVLIHCVLKFGLHTSYIYGGHFVFVIPMMWGWLFYSYKKSPRMLSFLVFLVGIITVYFITNNLYRMQEFFGFVEQYYR